MYTIATDNWVTQGLAPINLWTSGNNPVPISLAMSAKGTGVNSSVTAVDVAIEIPANTNRVLINLLPDAGGDNGTDALQVNGSAAVQTDPITSKQVVNLETLQSYTGGSPTANWDGGTGWSRLPPNTANTVWRIPFSEFADAGFSSSTGITGGGFYWELNGSQGDGYGGLYGVLGSSSLPGYAFFFDSNNSGSPGGLVGVIPYYTDGGFTADGGGMQLTGDVSMSFWFSPISSIETIGSILFLGSNNVTSAFGIGYKGSNGSITAYITSSDRLVSSYCTYSVVGPFLISEGTNTIYFIAETYNHLTGIATLYIDGNLACQSGSVLEPDGGGGNFTYNGTWFLGDSGPGGGNYWRGYMWDPDLETQTNWTQAQVQQRMNIYFGR